MMASAITTNRCLDDILIIFSEEKISDKKYKDQKKNEIINATCALMNSNGGKIKITGITDLTRTLEQSLKSRFGDQGTNYMVEETGEKMIEIDVRKACFLVSMKYNLYRPSEKQVELIGDVQNALEIMKGRVFDQHVERGSHSKIFSKNKRCGGLRENRVTQFKHLKSAPSKHFTLADRMVGKRNKFSCYVSAFANHRGGHIYYGIDDDGIVQGENTEEHSEIEKKVEKAIQKMIWPDTIGQPKQGEHWEIFFEPVLDEMSNPIPSTFVIVIFIAPCSGGVFTEEPESYEMVEGNVERMSFTTWKEKLQPVGLNKRKREVPSTGKRVSLGQAAKRHCTEAINNPEWKSRKLEVPSTITRVSLLPETIKRCGKIYEFLTELINNGKWKLFKRKASIVAKKYPNNLEVKLIVLSRRVMVKYRQRYIHKASSLLNKFQQCIHRSEQPLIFEVLLYYLKIAVARVSMKTAAEARNILIGALANAELIQPGLFTAAVYLVLASIYDNSQNDPGLSPDILCIKAIQHLQYVEDAPVARADLYHNAHITLAAYHLGYNLSGKVIKKVIDKESFQKAKESINAVKQSETDGNPLTEYRKIWFILAQSMLYIRHAEFEPEQKKKHLKKALDYSKEAEHLAKSSHFLEIVPLAQNLSKNCVPL